jgi:hypothetical protein
MSRFAIAAVAALGLAACGGVTSTSPASDASTTRLDERLLGFWRVDDASTPDSKGTDQRGEVFAVGKRKDGTALTMVLVQLRGDGTLDSGRHDVLPTTIGPRDYASLTGTDDAGKRADARSWNVVRYEMPDADTLRVIGMEEKAVAADVRSKAVPGSVSETKDEAAGKTTLDVTIDASTEVLRAYLEKRGDAILRPERPLVLRRIRMR